MQTIKVGDKVVVAAWWCGAKPPVPGDVIAVSRDGSFVTVRPTQGNPHVRYVNVADVLSVNGTLTKTEAQHEPQEQANG